MKKNPYKYEIIHTAFPSKKYKTKEEIEMVHKKVISLLVDDLILNGHLKTGE